MENNKEEKPYNTFTLVILGLFVCAGLGGLLYGGVTSESDVVENDSAKVTLSLDLNIISDKLKKDSAFLTPYLNTYIETDGAILTYTRTEQDQTVRFGIIGVHRTDSALWVYYPLFYDSLFAQKNKTACDTEKLRSQQIDTRKEAASFIYADVDFNNKDKRSIHSPLYNDSCESIMYPKRTFSYDLQYFTIEHIKVKGLLTSFTLGSDSVYYLNIRNSVLISRVML